MKNSFNPDKYNMNLEEGYKHIVSYSGGKDSTAVILVMVEKEIRIDEIVFFDNGWEFPQIYEHNRKLEKYINKKITVLKPEKSFEWWMYEKPTKIGKGKGWPRFNLRWCTGVMQRTIKDYKNTFPNHYDFIGICYDEADRLQKRRKYHFNSHKYPLIQFQIKEKESKQICFEHGFDFGGLYQYMKSSSCFCCPLQPINSLRNLYRYFPELWEKLMEMDKRTNTPFRIGKTVSDGIYLKDIEKRFQEECKQKLITKWLEMN